MFLNRNSIEKINELKAILEADDMALAQTNSRYNGSYLECIRVYQRSSDKGHISRAIEYANTLTAINDLIKKYER